jgi:osmotically-inducible protein OsmY
MKSDVEVQEDILLELKSAVPSLYPAIGVEVHDGVVVLTGTAVSDEQRIAAEQAAQRVEGVQALDDEISIAPRGWQTRKDAEIARSVRGLFLWKTYASHESIEITVVRGWVTLSGETEHRYQRWSVNEAIRALTGVRGLTDHVIFRSRDPAAAMRSDVWAALK